ncbi:TetR family transcriptional regulator [Brachybacterium sp. GCM10030268]|uniref:TetR family transcriptional regulator n=1 Tax=Brachybacterium sp. GCM10030268 TaxID=3273382 RepID=UPI0036133861
MQNPKLSKDEVARAALRILDEMGLPDLTMRRLAADLNVRPSALYWYFPNKQTLLADLADRIVTQGRPAELVTGWDEQLRLVALALRDSLLAYRDSAEIVSSSLALGLGENPAHSTLRDALDSSPFDAEMTQRAAATMLHFILGHVSLEQQRIQYDSLGALSGEPVMLRMESCAGAFRFGVDTIISGLKQHSLAHPTATPGE